MMQDRDRAPSAAELEEQRMLATSTIEELADYYDRTDTGDLPWDAATDVTIKRWEQVSVGLPQEDLAELKRRASESGTDYATLLRSIVRDHLQRPAGTP